MRSVAFVLAVCCCGVVGRELKQVQLLHRHGDRTSMSKIPSEKNPPDWKALLGLGDGMLTTRGAVQAKQLGLWLREEYIKKINLLQPTFHPLEVYARSTNLHRTITTANMVLAGLFDNNTRFDDISQETVVIGPGTPVTMVAWQDEILQSVDFCPYYFDVLQKRLYESEEWLKVEQENIDLLKWFQNITGYPSWRLADLFSNYDSVYVENVHNVITIPELKGTPILANITKLMGWSVYKKINAGGKYVGGPLFYLIGQDMFKMVNDSANAYKYIEHSGHDTTLLSLFAASGFFDTNPFLQGLPRYASAIIFELWKEDDGSYSVSSRYRDGMDGTVHEVNILEGKTSVSFDDFRKLTTTNGMTSDAWCSECSSNWNVMTSPATCLRLQNLKPQPSPSPSESDDNHEKVLRHSVTALSVSLALSLIAVICLMFVVRRKNRVATRESLLGMK